MKSLCVITIQLNALMSHTKWRWVGHLFTYVKETALKILCIYVSFFIKIMQPFWLCFKQKKSTNCVVNCSFVFKIAWPSSLCLHCRANFRMFYWKIYGCCYRDTDKQLVLELHRLPKEEMRRKFFGPQIIIPIVKTIFIIFLSLPILFIKYSFYIFQHTIYYLNIILKCSFLCLSGLLSF